MAQAPLPGKPQGVDILKDVQGDVVLGFPKKKQEFVFFEIENAPDCKGALTRLKVNSTQDVIAANAEIARVKCEAPGTLAHVSLLNIALSKKGLDVLGVQGDFGDQPFNHGQLAGAQGLGDSSTEGAPTFEADWEAAFKLVIHGVLIAAGDSWKSVKEALDHASNVFGQSIKIVYRLKGSVRPDKEKGREHFGWEDGISNPAVIGIGVDGHGTTLPGQRKVNPGVILRGLDGDFVTQQPPKWGVGGSLLVFRQIEQHVPEFHEFLKLEAHRQGLPPTEGAELLGARLVGRWKSGVPIQRTPDLKDIPDKGLDKQFNNDFVYPQDTGDAGQILCPYAAHIRKTNPRNDLNSVAPDGSAVARASIIRAGIPYGPELSFSEQEEKVTELERGLAFVSYQSSIQNGFQFMQESWANNTGFPILKNVTPGFDPIIGQAGGKDRDTWGTANGFKVKGMPEFVKARGGEYFFVPTIPVLKNGFTV